MREHDAGRGGSDYSRFCRVHRDDPVEFKADYTMRMQESYKKSNEPNEPPVVLVVMKRLDLRGTSDPTSGVLAIMRTHI